MADTHLGVRLPVLAGAVRGAPAHDPGVTTTQTRRPAGTPVGGQFAGTDHAEASVQLTDEQKIAVHRQAHLSASYWARKYDLDVDDLATRLIDQVANQRYGRFVDEAYTHHVAGRIALLRLTGIARGEDWAAWREYARRLTDWENAHGQMASPGLAQRIADQVRADQPPGRRASPGFHLQAARQRVRSLDGGPGGGGPQNHPQFMSPGADDYIDTPRPSTGADDERIDQLGALAREQGAYAALAEAYRLPPVKIASIGEEAASRIRRQIRALDGPRQAASRWLAGEIDDATAEPLFVPFGGSRRLTIQDMSAVAQRLRDLPAGTPKADPAGVAFDSAVRSATRGRRRAPRQWDRANRGKRADES